jgi:hypothetical protein
VQSSSFPALNQIENFGLKILTGMIKELHLIPSGPYVSKKSPYLYSMY